MKTRASRVPYIKKAQNRKRFVVFFSYSASLVASPITIRALEVSEFYLSSSLDNVDLVFRLQTHNLWHQAVRTSVMRNR